MAGGAIFPEGLGGLLSASCVVRVGGESSREASLTCIPIPRPHIRARPGTSPPASSPRGDLGCLDTRNALIPWFLLQALGQWGLLPFVSLGHLKMQRKQWLLFGHRNMHKLASNLRGTCPSFPPQDSHGIEHFITQTARTTEALLSHARHRAGLCVAGGAGQPPYPSGFLAIRMPGAQRYWTCRHSWR